MENLRDISSDLYEVLQQIVKLQKTSYLAGKASVEAEKESKSADRR